MALRSRSRIYQGVVVLAIIALFVLAWTQRDRFTPVDAGSRAPSFDATSIDGAPFRMADLRGKVIVLNYWATWCAPCRREMPALQRVHEQLGPRGLKLVAISTDDAPTHDVREYAKAMGLTIPIIHDVAPHALENLYLVQGLPTTFIIDKKGRIALKVMGAREWDDPAHMAEFERLLSE